MCAQSTDPIQERAGQESGDVAILLRDSLDHLFEELQTRGYRCVGPTVRDGAIGYEEITGAEALPVGWVDDQGPGHYRLLPTDSPAVFAHVVGPHSLKRFLFPAELRLWRLQRQRGSFSLQTATPTPPRYAFLGVRACDLAALRIHDRIFRGGDVVDPYYDACRDQALFIAVNCTRSAPTCFCASMGTGPAAVDGFDLALTELLDGDHRFLIRAGSARGRELLAALPTEPAREVDLRLAKDSIRAAPDQSRGIAPEAAARLLPQHPHARRWSQIAERCLSCANCTMACPTCFCSDVEDVSDLRGEHADRWRRWDSCFNEGFGYIHGGEVRRSTAARYRHWLTHKLSGWYTQFDSSGCVGCGRCITWCPVGIDLTEEVELIRQESMQ